MPPLLEVDDLHMHFFTRDGVVKAVDGVSFTLENGQTLGVVGESGSGKSVTAMSIMRLIPEPPGKVVSGDIRFKGESILAMSEKEQRKLRGNRIAMIFQDPMTSLNPVYRIGKQIAEPLRLHKGMTRKEAWAAAVELLRQVGIPQAEERARNYPHEFSGGMRQRAMIAMALACGPDILIADEPTTALDVTIQAQILDLMQEIQKNTDSAIILITHDLGVVADMADNILVMYGGRPVEYGTAGRGLLQPHPSLHLGPAREPAPPRRRRQGRSLPHQGSAAQSHQPAEGLLVQPALRLRARTSACGESQPPLVEVEPGHFSSCLFAGDIDFICQFENRVTRQAATSAGVDELDGAASRSRRSHEALPGEPGRGLLAPGQDGEGRGRRQLRRRARGDARAGGRVRLRQVDHRALHQPAARGRRRAPSSSRAPTCASCAASSSSSTAATCSSSSRTPTPRSTRA